MTKNVRCGKVGCQKKLAQGRRKYCSDNCQAAQYMRNKRRGKEEVKPINAERDTSASASYHVVKNAPVPVGSTLKVVSGQKIVLNANDKVQVYATANTVDVVASILEGVT